MIVEVPDWKTPSESPSLYMLFVRWYTLFVPLFVVYMLCSFRYHAQFPPGTPRPRYWIELAYRVGVLWRQYYPLMIPWLVQPKLVLSVVFNMYKLVPNCLAACVVLFVYMLMSVVGSYVFYWYSRFRVYHLLFSAWLVSLFVLRGESFFLMWVSMIAIPLPVILPNVLVCVSTITQLLSGHIVLCDHTGFRQYIFADAPYSYMFYVIMSFAFHPTHSYMSYGFMPLLGFNILVATVTRVFMHFWAAYRLRPQSGMEEKDYRRSLFTRKSKGRELYAAAAHFSMKENGPKVPKPNLKLSRKEIERIYKNAKNLEPCSITQSSVTSRLKASWRSFTHGRQDKTIAFLESMAILSGNLIYAHNNKARSGIILQWIHSHYCKNEPMLYRCTELLGFFMKFSAVDLQDAANSVFGTAQDDETVLFQADGLDLGSMPTGDKTFLDGSDTINRFKKMMQMFVDIGMCNIFGLECTQDFAPRTLEVVGSALKHISLVEYVTGSVMFFIERGYAAYDKGSVRHFFFANEFADFEVEFRSVKSEVEGLAYGFVTTEHAAKKQDLVKRVENLKKTAERQLRTLRGLEKTVMSDRYGVILFLEQTLMIQNLKVGARRVPFSICLYGEPGVGKSWIMQSMTPHLLKRIGLPWSSDHIIYPTARDDYDTPHNNKTLAIIIDDLANIRPAYTGKVSPVDTILRIVNNIISPAVKAELREKGNIFINPWVFWVSTNVKDLQASTYSNDQLAILRRFNYTVTHHLDSRYMTNGACDVKKWPPENLASKIPPCTFTVETIANDTTPATTVPNGVYGLQERRIKYEQVMWACKKLDGSVEHIQMKSVPFTTLEAFMMEKVTEHTDKQTAYLEELSTHRDPEFCEHRHPRRSCMHCLRPASGTTDVEVVTGSVAPRPISRLLGPADGPDDPPSPITASPPSTFEENLRILDRWYRTFGDKCSRTIAEIESIEDYENAIEARCMLANYNVSMYIPLNILMKPSTTRELPTGADSLANSRFTNVDLMMIRDVCHHTVESWHHIQAAKEQRTEDDVEIDGIQQEISHASWHSRLIQVVFSPICALGVKTNQVFMGSAYFCAAVAAIPIATIALSALVCVSVSSVLISVPSVIVLGTYGLLNTFSAAVGLRAKWLYDNVQWIRTVSGKMRDYSRIILKRRYAAILAAVVVFAIAARYIARRQVFEPHGSAQSTPVPMAHERVTTWVQNVPKVDLEGADLKYTNQPSELLQSISSCMVRVRVYPAGVATVPHATPGDTKGCGAFLLRGGLVVVPHHLVKNLGSGRLIQVLKGAPGAIVNQAAWLATANNVYHVPGTDFAIMHSVSLGSIKDLDMYLPERIVTADMNVNMHMRNRDWSVTSGAAAAHFRPGVLVDTVGVYDGYNMSVKVEGKTLVSQEGYCMAIFLSATSPSYIHSFYLAGRDGIIRSAPFLRGYVKDAREYFIAQGATMTPCSGFVKDHLTDRVSRKSPIGHVDKNENPLYFDWLGSLDLSGSRRFVGRVRETPFAVHLESVFGCTFKWRSPVNLGNWKPWYSNLVAMGEKVAPWDPIRMNRAQEDLTEHLLTNCRSWTREGKTFKDVVFPVSEEVAVNGVPGVAGIERVKLNTSAGWPICKAKDKVFHKIEDSSYPCGVRLEANAEVKEHLKEIEECAESGVRSNIIFRACPKDEPTLPEKEKVRIFAGCPVAYLIAVRKMTMTLVKFMTDNFIEFHTAAGANCFSYDWTALALYLTQFGTSRFIAGDYSEYDKKMLADIMCRACEITLSLLREAGYNEDQISMTRNLILESCFPIYEWNGDLLQIFGTNPSGQPLTIWLNNLANLLYQRYVFYTFYSFSLKFAECVTSVVMGDDNIMGVREGYEKFNHTAMVDALGAHGLVYTMADKKTASVPFIEFEDASLLKRQFKWSDDLGVYLCPIEEKSIFRSLHSCMIECGSKSQTMADHCVMMLQNALAEWFYFGRDVYEDRLVKCTHIMHLAGYQGRLLDWEEQLQEFKKRIIDSRILIGADVQFPWIYEPVEPEILDHIPAVWRNRLVQFGCGRDDTYRLDDYHAWVVLVDDAEVEDLGAFADLELDAHVVGLHAGKFFDDDDPRIISRRGDWVLVEHDQQLDLILMKTFRKRYPITGKMRGPGQGLCWDNRWLDWDT